MRRSVAAASSFAWFVAMGGTFGCLLPYLLNDWHFHRPLPYWGAARAVGVLLICAGLVPLVNSFAQFFTASPRRPPRQAQCLAKSGQAEPSGSSEPGSPTAWPAESRPRKGRRSILTPRRQVIT